MKRPACIGGIEILAILLFSAYLPRAAFWLPAAVSLLIGCILLICNQKQYGGCLVGAAVVAFLIGCHTVVRLEKPPERYFGQSVWIEGVVVNTAEGYADEMTSAVIRVEQVDSNPADFFMQCPNMPECEIGEVVQGRYKLHKLPDSLYSYQLYADNIFCSADYQASFAVKGCRSTLTRSFTFMRTQMSKNLRRYLSRETGGVLAAMTTGDKNFLSPVVYNAYKAAGIPHILVVSGLHLSVLCGLVPLNRQTCRSRRRYGVFSALVALFLMGLAGNTPSVMRAGAAGILHSIGVFFSLPVDPLTSLAVSGVLLSIGNRYMVCDIAFQLSFAATAGVLLGAEILQKLSDKKYLKNRILESIRSQVLISGMAALFVLPVQAFHGLNISVISILSNLVSFLFLKPMLYCGLIAAVAGMIPYMEFIVRGACLVGGIFAKMLNEVVLFFAEIPKVQFFPETYFPGVCAVILILFVLWCWLQNYKVHTILALSFTLAVTAVLVGSYASQNLIKITMLGNASHPAVVATQNNQAVVLFRGGESAAREIQTYLKDRNVQQVSMVVDMRLKPNQVCPIQGEVNICLPDTAEYLPELHFPTKDIAVIMTMDLEGGVAALCCGNYAIWVPSGTLSENVGADHMEVLLASSADPGNLRNCDTILTLTRNHRWLETHEKPNVYCGESGAAVWIRPLKYTDNWPMRITGAEL